MRRRIAIIGVVGHLAVSAAAQGQTGPPTQQALPASTHVDALAGLTLEQAIALAIEQEPSLRAARTEVDVARGSSVQAGLRPNPTLSASYQTEPAGTDSQTRVEFEWPLDLFRKEGRVAVTEAEIGVVQRALADRERLLAAEVRAKYGELAVGIRELSVTEELLTAVTKQHGVISARVDEGAAPRLERDMLRVELQRLESERQLQAGLVEATLIELKRLLGLAVDAPLTVRESLDQLVRREAAVTLPAGGRARVAGRPDVQQAEARVMAADARVDRARRDGRFDVSLFAMYMRMDAGFPQSGFGEHNTLERVRGVFHYVAGGATVTVPFRSGNQGEVAVAQAQRAGAAAELDAARLTAEAEIAAARVRDEHARRAAAVYSADASALARQNLDVVGQTYALGRATVFEVLAEQRRYLDVERAHTNALREAYEARQALRRALGEVR